MKLLLLIFFALTTPIVIFLTSLQFGGIEANDIKTSLAATQIYAQTSTMISSAVTSDTQDAQGQALSTIVKNRFTKEYIQTKAELTIDQTASWMQDKSKTSPVISFKEVKDDITAQNPELLPALHEAAKQAEENANAQSTDNTQNQQTATAMKTLDNLAKSDFTFDLGKYLQGVKVFYMTGKIMLLIFGLLLLGSLWGIYALAINLSSRFQWFGALFLISGIVGYLAVFFNKMILNLGSNLLDQSSNQIVAVVKPFVLAVGTQMMQHYINLQGEINVSFLVAAAICFVLAKLTKPHVQESKPKGKKK